MDTKRHGGKAASSTSPERISFPPSKVLLAFVSLVSCVTVWNVPLLCLEKKIQSTESTKIILAQSIPPVVASEGSSESYDLVSLFP